MHTSIHSVAHQWHVCLVWDWLDTGLVLLQPGSDVVIAAKQPFLQMASEPSLCQLVCQIVFSVTSERTVRFCKHACRHHMHDMSRRLPVHTCMCTSETARQMFKLGVVRQMGRSQLRRYTAKKSLRLEGEAFQPKVNSQVLEFWLVREYCDMGSLSVRCPPFAGQPIATLLLSLPDREP